ncbi:MAG: cobalamin-binding protein [Pseudomonadota bacterium]
MTRIERAVRMGGLWLALAACGSSGAAVVLPPDRGEAAGMPARRIVALAPHVAELVWAAGAGHRLVGVVAGSDWPVEVRSLPVIGSPGRLDRERVAALAPDLAIGWTSGDPPADLAWLRARGVAVHSTDARRLEDVAASLRAIGRLAGVVESSERAAAAFERELASVSSTAGGASPRVFYQVWDRPPMTVSSSHYIGQAIERCGGVNVFGSLPQPVPVVSAEAVLASRAQVVVAARGAADPFARWRDRPALPAVLAGRTRTVDPDLLHRPGPRLIEGLRQLCAAIGGA